MTVKNFGLNIASATEKMSRKDNRATAKVGHYAIRAKRDLKELNNLRPSLAVIKPSERPEPRLEPEPVCETAFVSMLELAYPRSGVCGTVKVKPIKRAKLQKGNFSKKKRQEEMTVKRAEWLNRMRWGI